MTTTYTVTPASITITRTRQDGTLADRTETRTASAEEYMILRGEAARLAMIAGTTREAAERAGRAAARKAIRARVGTLDADTILREEWGL